MPNNFLPQIYLFSFKGPPEVIINRAAVISNIIEKFPNIIGKVSLNKEKQIEFSLENGKKKIKLTITNVSWLAVKEGRKKATGVLLNRRQIIPILKGLNNE